MTKTRYVGTTPEGGDYVEVGCEGGGALMVEYGPGVQAVKAVLNCGQAKSVGGGCKFITVRVSSQPRTRAETSLARRSSRRAVLRQSVSRNLRGSPPCGRGDLAVAHDDAAADDGGHRPAGGLEAVEGGPADAGGHVVVADGAPGLQVDDGQVGVVAHGQPALVGQAEDALRRRGWSGRRSAPGVSRPVGHVGQHHRHQGLHARHARGRGRIGPGLLLAGVRRVVGAEHVGDALRDRRATAPSRWRASRIGGFIWAKPFSRS